MIEDLPNTEAPLDAHTYPHQLGYVTAEQLSRDIGENPGAYHADLDPYMEANGIAVERPPFEDSALSAEISTETGHDWAKITADVPISPAHRASGDALAHAVDPSFDNRDEPAKRAVTVITELGDMAEQVDMSTASERSPLPTTAEVEAFYERGFVKDPPIFSEQLQDTGRDNIIRSNVGLNIALGEHTGKGDSVALFNMGVRGEMRVEEATEHDSLVSLDAFLANVEQSGAPNKVQKAHSLRENLTYIGQKEYNEAVKGLASIWKESLESNPDKQICVPVGELHAFRVKSDAYMLDKVLQNFSDDELTKYAHRIVTNPGLLTSNPENTDVILLDDWTVSGSQMREAASKLAGAYPDLKNRMQIQLITATEKRITQGIPYGPGETVEGSVPVRAFYRANDADYANARWSGAHITGSHCAVDFDFNDLIGEIAGSMNIDMPLTTNIIRSYREDTLHQLERIQQLDPTNPPEYWWLYRDLLGSKDQAILATWMEQDKVASASQDSSPTTSNNEFTTPDFSFKF